MNRGENIIPKLLIIVAILFAIYVIHRQSYTENKECFKGNKPNSKSIEKFEEPENIEEKSYSNLLTEDEIDDISISPNDLAPEASQEKIEIKQNLLKKMKNINAAPEGEFKKSNYSESQRGNFGPNDWEQEFTEYSELLKDKTNNDKFIPVDETGGNYQAYKSNPYKKNKEKPEDLLDSSKLLPSEVRDDWFDVMPDSISVKDRHLINVTKPIGINTIGSSLRNANYDLRAAPPCPKFVVSPWMQTTIEPDLNTKSF